MKIPNRKRKGIAFFNFITFPLFVFLIASLFIIGQTQTPYQIANPFGISNIFSNNYNLPTTNVNPNNITISSSFPVNNIANSHGCSLKFTSTVLAGLPNLIGYIGCVITQGITSSITSLLFSSTVSSGSPQTILSGFLNINIAVIGIAVVSGISVVSTGLSTASIYILFKNGGYLLIYLILAGISFPVFASMGIFGNLFFFFLSGVFTIGIFRDI